MRRENPPSTTGRSPPARCRRSPASFPSETKVKRPSSLTPTSVTSTRPSTRVLLPNPDRPQISLLEALFQQTPIRAAGSAALREHRGGGKESEYLPSPTSHHLLQRRADQ